MSRPIAVLRPEPGNRVTAVAIEAAGRHAIRLPLFVVAPVEWTPPDPAQFDALVLTSANALRHGGAGLAALRDLPVHAVGDVTAEAARRMGFEVATTGNGGAAELLAASEAAGVRRALHLAGRDRSVEPGGIVAEVVTVYDSHPRVMVGYELRALAGSVALVQSARAGARLAQLVDGMDMDRGTIALVTVSARAAEAAGTGWEEVVIASPDGAALVEAALALAD